jgi:hypothetical protein
MKALVSLIALCWVPACQFAWAQAPVRACGQIDQIQQTRCQIENAFASRNLDLLNRLFATSVYADVNDTTACGGSGYMTCAFKTRNSEFVSALFRAGYSPQPLIKNNYAQLTYAFVILLCHKFRRRFRCIEAAQHGHLGSRLTRAAIRRCRVVAIELGTCRWVRSGRASGSVTFGNGRCLERPGGTRA